MGLIIINVSSAEEAKEEIEANLNTFKLVSYYIILAQVLDVPRGIFELKKINPKVFLKISLFGPSIASIYIYIYARRALSYRLQIKGNKDKK